MQGRLILALTTILPATALFAAQPSALANVAGGLWEITGAPGTRAPVRQCVRNVLALAQYEHRGRNCSRSIISDSASSTKINYKCGSAGFGESEVDVITPRSLRISTQGISDQLPFNYVLQARRVGECTKAPESAPH
ncbi:MAG TPA: hypothetical protein VHE36_08345 [Sphingomicrobium sp.]|jgi:hypothetical protein|nr:hypothetical protein [Sphingomicrobium sp.]